MWTPFVLIIMGIILGDHYTTARITTGANKKQFSIGAKESESIRAFAQKGVPPIP